MIFYDWVSILNRFKDKIDIVNVLSGGILLLFVKDYLGY